MVERRRRSFSAPLRGSESPQVPLFCIVSGGRRVNELREWGKAYNCPYGTLVLHTEDRTLARTMSKRKSLSGTRERQGRGVGPDPSEEGWQEVQPSAEEATTGSM